MQFEYLALALLALAAVPTVNGDNRFNSLFDAVLKGDIGALPHAKENTESTEPPSATPSPNEEAQTTEPEPDVEGTTMESMLTPAEKAQAKQAVLDIIDDLPGGDAFFEYCASEPAVGRCTGHFKYFYFDMSRGICRTFEYGGCHGNLNRFETEWSCMETCMYAPARRAGAWREKAAREAAEFESMNKDAGEKQQTGTPSSKPHDNDAMWREILPTR